MLSLWLALAGPPTSGHLEVHERVVLERRAVRVVESQRYAPTGLPIADPTRRLMLGDAVLGTLRGAEALATTWPKPERSPAEARALAEAAGYTVRSVLAEHRPSDGRVRWRVDVAFDPLLGARPLLWIDDPTGALLVGPDQVRSVAAAAYARNPVLDPVPDVFELEDVVLPLEGLRTPLFDVRQCEDPGTLGACVLAPVEPSAQADFVFAAPQTDEDHADGTDPFSAASVAVHAQAFFTFASAHGLPLPTCVAEGTRGTLVANYRGFTGEDVIAVANAGYTGDCSILAFFGQGPAADWGYDADVVVHELTHGSIAAQMGEGRVLGLARRRSEAVVTDAGAINESIADFVAAVVTGDSAHGEYVRTYDGGFMRDADNARRCPEDLLGQIHYDSEPLTGALWQAHADLGDALVEPVLDAVAMLEQDATYEEASASMLALTEATMGSAARDTLFGALADHNLIDCERVAALEQVRGPVRLLPRYGSGGYYDPMRPGPMQLRVEVPQDAATMTVTFSVAVIPEPGWDPVGDVHVLVRSGAPVSFSYDVDEEDRTTVAADPDLHLPSVNDGTFTADVVPGEPVYLAFFNQGLHVTQIDDFAVSFEASAGSSTGGEGDDESTTGTPMPSTDSSGGTREPSANAGSGGCRVGEGPRGLFWLLLLAWPASQTLQRRRR